MHRLLLVATLVALAGALACRGEEGRRSQAPPCTPSGRMMRLADLPEASGLVASRTTPGRFWAHNDSGAPILFALDANGKTTGRVTLNGATVEDWEALAIGPCPPGSCLYVADIGDNGARRSHITIYRLPEPTRPEGAVATEIFHASYPDGAHDAEALLVSPEGRLFIVTKGDTGPISLYRFPRELKTGTSMKLERMGQPLSEKPAEGARITDGAMSRDGQRMVLRTPTALVFYPSASFLRGDFSAGRVFDISALREPQGEAVTFDTAGTVYVAGEGGGKGVPGTLAALACPQ